MTALPLDVGPEVARALGEGRAVVALESTIVTHGLPRPRNLEVARAAEAAVRDGGAVPATIAVLSGRLRVGLDGPALEALAAADGLAKLSRADLAACLASGGSGATTVAATMIAARAAGVEVFATGGIGGVHRGAGATFDVSADLHELARTAVTVVASGAKAILDLPATLEVLETLGVTVVAVGQDALPAFWSRDSGLRAPLRMDYPSAIARAHRLRAALGLERRSAGGEPGARRARDPHVPARPAHRARGGRGRRGGRARQARDAVDPVPAGRADRGPHARRQRRAGGLQCGSRRADRPRTAQSCPRLDHLRCRPALCFLEPPPRSGPCAPRGRNWSLSC